MAILLCPTYPQLRIYVPSVGDYAAFSGGKLEIETDDPRYETVMAEASKNPNIAIVTGAATCQWCGESFTGGAARLNLGTHMKANHFDQWIAAKDAADAEVRMVEVKARAGFPCAICAPAQDFGTEDDLSIHMTTVHAAAPRMDVEGNTTEPDEAGGATRSRARRPGEVAVAKPSTRKRGG